MKHFSTRFLMALLIFMSVWAQATAFTVDGLNFEMDDEGGVMVTGSVSQSITSVSIPASVTFNGASLTVNSIKYDAFHDCGELREVRIEDAPSLIYCPPYVDENGELVYDSPFRLSPVESFYIGRDFAEESVSRSRTVRSVSFASAAPTLKMSFGGTISNIYSVFSNSFSLKVTSLSFGGNIGGFSTNAFTGMTNLKAVTLRTGNYNLPSSAFSFTTLDTVIISDTSYQKMPFTSVKNVILDEGWTTIPSRFMSSNTSVETVTLPSTLTEIGQYAFNGCNSLKSINFPDSLRIIDNSAFSGCRNLESPKFNEGLEEINAYAFENCDNILELELPGSLKSIDNNAFRINGNLTKVLINSSNDESPLDIYNYSFGNTKIDNLILNRTFVFSSSSKNLYWNPKNVVFGEIWTTIPSSFMSSNTAVETVTLPSTLTEIGQSAFANCSSLKTINYPESLRKIGDSAFSGCRNMESPIFNVGLNEIGRNTFSRCNSFSNVVIPGSITQIGEFAFDIESTLETVIIEPATDNSELNVTGKFLGNTEIDSLVLNRRISLITETNQFLHCNPKNVVFGNCWVIIPTRLFYSGIKSFQTETISLPSTIVEIQANAFSSCHSLKSINFPKSLRKIGDSAFAGCKLLEFPTLNEGLEEIGSYTFSRCNSFSKVAIPGSVTQIGEFAFDIENTLETVIIEPATDNSELIVTGKFLGNTEIDSLVLNRKISLISETNQYLHCKPKYLLFGEGWTSISNRFLYYNKAVETVTLPSTLTQIGQNAFYNCTNLKEITSFAKKAPACDGNSVFASEIYPTAELTVPLGSRREYASANVWKNFANIRTDGMLTASVDYNHEHGSVTLNGLAVDSIEVDEGEPVDITIEPATGFTIKTITANGDDCMDKLTGNVLHFDEISDSLNVVIDLAPIMFTVSIENEIVGGWLEINGSTDPAPIRYGSRVEILATASEGYLLKALSVNGNDVETDANGIYIIDSLTENLNVSATFEIIRFKATAVYDQAMGSVSLNDAEGSCMVDYGKSLSISVTPNEGRYIRNIYVNGIEEDTDAIHLPIVIERVTADTEVKVEFAIYTYTVTADYNDDMGSVTVNGSEGITEAEWGTDVIVKVTPDYGYQISTVKIDGKDVTDKLEASGIIIIKDIKENHTVEVTFEVKRVRLSLAGIEGGMLTTIHDFDTEVRYFPEAQKGWEFHSATAIENVITNLDSDGSFTVGPLTEDTVLSVVFRKSDLSVDIDSPVASGINVTVKNRTISIAGAPEDAVANVYDTGGKCFYSGRDRSIDLPGSGVYLVNIAGETFKLFLR